MTIDPDALDAVAAASGNVRAFEQLYRRHACRVHTIARRIAGRAEADDAMQEVFIRAWECLGSFRGESAFGTWLQRVATNVCLRYAERDRGRREAGDLGLKLVHTPERPQAIADVAEALERLPESLRQVVVLHDLEGYSHAEIAAVLATTVSASK